VAVAQAKRIATHVSIPRCDNEITLAQFWSIFTRTRWPTSNALHLLCTMGVYKQCNGWVSTGCTKVEKRHSKFEFSSSFDHYR